MVQVLLNAFKRHELSEVVDVELSRDEDSVTSLAAAQSNDTSIVAFAGINSSLALQQQNKNRHLRSFQIDYPPRRTGSKESTLPAETKPGQTVNLSQESLFRTVAGPKGTTDTYQRITRLSPWKEEGATRVAAITTGLAPSGEIVFFNANTKEPGESDVIGRIRLNSDEEAEDVDITGQDEDDGTFSVAYTNGLDVFTCRISPETRSHVAPDVKRVYTPPANPKGKGPRAKFRALRFLSPTTLLLLQNAPDRKGCELILLDLRPTISSSSSQATIIRQYKLRKSIKLGLGLDVCNLGANSDAQQQSIIAISGGDQSLEVLTIDFDSRRQHRTSAGYTPFRVYTTLRDVHPFSMTRICFSHCAPPSPVAPETPPQYVKLASVSMGNTVVVHTFPLSPVPPSSRNPRYVLVRPGESEFLTGLAGTLASFLSIALVVFLLQAITEIRGVMPPYLGITEHLPPNIRAAIARPYNAPTFPPTPSPIEHTPPNSNTEPEESQPQLLRDIIPDTETSILISCNPSNNELLVEPHTPNPNSQFPEEVSEVEPDLNSHTTFHHARHWPDLSTQDRLAWKAQLTKAGLWGPQEHKDEDEDESILQRVFVRELCPQSSFSSEDREASADSTEE